jgi:very-short-patch-repair endonuclease
MFESSFAPLQELVRRGNTSVIARRNSRAALKGWRIEGLLGMDVQALNSAWIDACMAFFLVRPFRKKAARKLLAIHRNTAVMPPDDHMEQFLNSVRDLQSGEKIWKDAGTALSPVLVKVWNNGEPAPGALDAALAWHKEFNHMLAKVAGADAAATIPLRKRSAELAAKKDSALTNKDGVAERFYAALAGFEKVWKDATELLSMYPDHWAAAQMPAYAIALADAVEGNAQHLASFCRIRKLRALAFNMELRPILDAYDAGRMPAEALPGVFDLAYARASLSRLVSEEEILRSFFGDEHELRIARFRSVDEKLALLMRQVIAAMIASRRPPMTAVDGSAADFGEVGILNAELTKKSRHKPIRRLLGEIPTILPKLKPCLLMSPLSVAQYLDPKNPPFDAIVFDEASQIPVCEAIGAMARGMQVIVTGDPQQLPPTAFFQRGEELEDESAGDDADESSIPEDAESILDECRATGLAEVRLRWHYRSRNESLIAFSNHHYYDDNLFTFPGPDVEDKGVSLVQVDGVYDRGGSKTNRKEAEAIVKAIVAHFTDKAMDGLSLGVVTFNSQQQRLVEELWDDVRRKDPHLDQLVAEDKRERMFIKNLENVQGDERDVIFFCTTYGKDSSGNMSQNYGPLSKPGGQKRLNVAVTRARVAVRVFTSLRPSDIDLSKVSEDGPKHLRNYLEYAGHGAAATNAVSQLKDAPIAEAGDFENKVASALGSKGWEVRTRIGSSAYRIDIAVVHPDKKSRFALGIECDGPSYQRCATSRDRDRLRRMVLGGLGWKLQRVWSADWYREPAAQAEKLFAVVEKAIEDGKPATVAPPQPMQEAPAPSTPMQANHVATESTKKDVGIPYRKIDTVARAMTLDPYDPTSVNLLRSAIHAVASEEGPICLTLMCERIAAMLDMKRATGKLRQRLDKLVPRELPRTRAADEVFVWPQNVKPDAYDSFRTHEALDPQRRPIHAISPQEQANAMEHILRTYYSMPVDDLLRQAAQLFGYSSLTQKMREQFTEGLANLEARSGIAKEGDAYKVSAPTVA